jgi:hypothetical protein
MALEVVCSGFGRTVQCLSVHAQFAGSKAGRAGKTKRNDNGRHSWLIDTGHLGLPQLRTMRCSIGVGAFAE